MDETPHFLDKNGGKIVFLDQVWPVKDCKKTQSRPHLAFFKTVTLNTDVLGAMGQVSHSIYYF